MAYPTNASDEIAAAEARMADRAADAVGRVGVRSDGTTMAGDAKAAAKDLKGAALEQGRQLYEVAKGEATNFADQRKNDAAESIAGVATSLRDTGRGFEGRPNIKAFVESAADGLDQLAGDLRDRSFADIYGDVEAFARRSPVAVGVASLAAGFLLARFIKASSDEMSEAAYEAGRRRVRVTAVRRTPTTLSTDL